MTNASEPRIPRAVKIDPERLEAWISMNTVRDRAPSPGAEFIYVDDLIQGLRGDHFDQEGRPTLTVGLEAADYVQVLETADSIGVDPEEFGRRGILGFLARMRSANDQP